MTPALLIVEDDPDDLFLLQRALARLDCRLPQHCFGDGIELLAHLDQLAPGDPLPALLLLDLNLPRMDGREALRRLRDHPSLQALPVVVLSTSREQRDREAVMALGAQAFLSKPDSLGGLVVALRGVLRSQGLLAEAA